MQTAHDGQRTGGPAKLFHFGSFALWAFLLGSALAGNCLQAVTKRAYLVFALAALIFVWLPEVLQTLNPDRHPAWLDVGINFAGALLGAAAQFLLVRFSRAK